MNEDEVPDDWPTDGDQRTFETEHTGRPPSVAIIEAIAAIEDVQSSDVNFTLYERIDPDALDALFADRETDEEVENGVVAEFRVNDYGVIVKPDGTITIEAPEETD